MIPKKHRVSKDNFKNLRTPGQVLHYPTFSVRISSLPASSECRASFVVSSKISSKAVVRNTLRRRGYEVFRQSLPILKPTQFIFYLKKEVLSEKPPIFREQINSILKKYSI